MIWLLIGWSVSPTAHAGTPPPPTESARRAEYNRLREDLKNYAQRQIWPAVERAYNRCMELYPDSQTTQHEAWAPPTPMRQADHLYGAHAATARGDLFEVRRRVVRAMRKEQSAEALDWLWAIDTTYSEVYIQAPVGTSLSTATPPFDPVIAGSIKFATTTLGETGSFHGLLPRMIYTVGNQEFVVVGGQGRVDLDLTTGKKKKKKKKKRQR